MKPRLLIEGGITQTSLKNDRRLTKRLGSPIRLELYYSKTGEWYRAFAYYDSGDRHNFTGFAWGYGGEGPRGLLEFCQRHNISITLEEICALDNTTEGLSWAWPKEN